MALRRSQQEGCNLYTENVLYRRDAEAHSESSYERTINLEDIAIS